MRRRDLRLGCMYSMGGHADKDFKKEMKVIKRAKGMMGLGY